MASDLASRFQHMNALTRCFVLSVLLIPCATRAAAPESPEHAPFLTVNASHWNLVWNDEFDGSSLDSSKWALNLPWGGTDGTNRHHNNHYASYMQDHNVVVEDGKLKLLARREDVKDAKGKTLHFTQAMVTTSKTFRHQYGYWEVRVKLPTEAGPGLWPAFWTLADGWPPEMDICEVWTSTNRSHQGLCYRPPATRPTTRGSRERWDDINVDAPLPTGWTTYGMEWGPGYQIYNVNGSITKRVYGEYVPDVPQYILLNSGVDADRPPSEATVFPNSFDVDYVRVYARPEVPALHNGDFELDDLKPWKPYNQALPVGYDVHGGKVALRGDGESGAEQKIYGLRPKTTYTLSAWVKLLNGGGEARIGVKGHGGDEKFAASRATSYERTEVEFTTGDEAVSATVYCYVPGKASAALFDDVELRAK